MRYPGSVRASLRRNAEILITGHWNQLERLHGTIDPIATVQTIPNVGRGLASRANQAQFGSTDR
jgi:hypothetical protein